MANVTTYNKNNPELFTEIRKNLEEFKNNVKIIEIMDTKKSLKARDYTKIFKKTHLFYIQGKNITQRVTKCKNKRCGVYNIIIEGNFYAFKNPKTKSIVNKDLSCKSKNVVYIIECNKSKKNK